MAARSQPNASDSFLEQLLRSGPDVSGHDHHTEAEAEEVDYGETDDDAQDVEGPHRVDRARGTRRSPAERGKHDPISWRDWQRPEPRRRRSRSRSRGRDPRSFSEYRPSQEHRDSPRAHALAREQADRARWQAEQERLLPRPSYEGSVSPRWMRLERSYHPPEEAYHSMRDPHDGYLERAHTSWEPARYRHPGDPRSLPERRERYEGRAGSFDGHLHPTPPSLRPERTHAHMSHPRARLLAPEAAGDPWLRQPGEYLNDRPPPQRRILLQRAGPEEERLIIRRPLSPERRSPSDAWYLDPANGGLAASRRVEYDPRPMAGYPPVKDHGGWRHVPVSPPRERSSYRRRSPDTGHQSILHAARGASSPREAPEPSRMMRQRSRIQGYHGKPDDASATARRSVEPRAVASDAPPERLPGPPVLPGPPPVPDDHNTASQRQRITPSSDIPPAAAAQQAPKATHREDEESQEQPDKPAERVAHGEGLSKDTPQEVGPSGASGTGKSGESRAAQERALSKPAAAERAGVMARARPASRAVDTPRSKRPADAALADGRHGQSKMPRLEADPRKRISTASEVKASHAGGPSQGRESVDLQKARGRSSQWSPSTEDRGNMLPQQQSAEKPQGHGVTDGMDLSKEGSPDRTVGTTRRADKGRSEGASTFVRDFYARSERSASEKIADPRTRHGPSEAKRVLKEAKEAGKERPHEANGVARSSHVMREAPKAAAGRRDALKELRDRGGVKALGSLRDTDVHRGGQRRQRGSSRDAKTIKHAGLPSWLGDKPEDCNEWFYMDPKGELQGPCSISSFRLWLTRMKENSELDSERKEFLKCMVWRKGMNRREPLERLLGFADVEAAKRRSSLS